MTHPAGERSARHQRARDPRKGIHDLAEHLASAVAGAPDGRSVRERFELAVARVLRLRSVRLHVGGVATTGSAPVVREGGTIDVPVPGTNAVLRVAADAMRPVDAWDLQALQTAAQLAAVVLALERMPALPRTAPPVPAGALVGSSPPMVALRELIRRVAPADAPVLIEGESGVGKELVARQIHEQSRRARMPFVAVNCAALVETLLEAELFGIEDRTATGVRGRRGKFELADGGTLFLDEIGDLSLHAQAKLLRALQEMTIERVGGHVSQHVDVRVVAATNRNLAKLVEDGRFRTDLFYRLNCLDVRVPPLRQRRPDIPDLVAVFLARYAQGAVSVAPDATEALIEYDWPGNVRELERVVQRAAVFAVSSTITLQDLPLVVTTRYLDVFQSALDGGDTLRTFVARYVRLMLHRCGNNKREACRRLDISYHTLQAYLRLASRSDRPDEPAGAPAEASVGAAFDTDPAAVLGARMVKDGDEHGNE